ncbi:MAG: anhydro-N-acetylmuramic acid kinase [Porticoccaceae bacterium]|nr:anhydro-N-acetylmuramic acid kinase [Porticoccaceae bacterium]
MPAASAEYYIGLMSGTSIDAIDAVLVAFEADRPRIVASHSTPVPTALRNAILELCLPGKDHLDLLGDTDRAIGEHFAATTLTLLDKAGLPPTHINAIGSHGQTVRHRPYDKRPFTLQIGDPNTIAALTGIVTVADFRRKDIALGGQGAPLVPAFHRAAFHHSHHNRLVMNIGGIGNITWLPTSGPVIGFDTGPGNGLMDAWIQRHCAQPYDNEGAWATSGHCHSELLQRLLQHPFLARRGPRSTGREEFNLRWLDTVLADFHPLPPEDVQATLAHFTARTLAAATADLPGNPEEILVCGGGAHNTLLMTLLDNLLAPRPVVSTAASGIDPGLVEGAAFAWLARQALLRQPGSLASVTGASRDAVLGAIYFP